ncbi:hypothetical protein HELRODRAFT_181506 [Helobdella robusta]|uniref:Uncharacterized protein n=1 Tax=Helobdella robusta TaxID=6412 RepID=T1FH26_HELRO|nr:hypothetical protein HELRODRAFT_181506 [Helobdella robusta]ESN92312.1 hypothetical protein HELRODRAFT_181506 [Helobdella robusta]
MRNVLLKSLKTDENRDQLLKVKDVVSELPSSGSIDKMCPSVSEDWSVVTRTKQRETKRSSAVLTQGLINFSLNIGMSVEFKQPKINGPNDFSLKSNIPKNYGKKCKNLYAQSKYCYPKNLVLCKNREKHRLNVLKSNAVKRDFLTVVKIDGDTFDGPNSLCKNAEDQVIMADTKINTLKIFDLNGNLKTNVNTHNNRTLLWSPDCMYLCPHTKWLVVVERPPHKRITVIGENLYKITSFRYEATNPKDVCMDNNFKIFLLDSTHKKIYIFDQKGLLLNTLHCPDIDYPYNIAANKHNELFVCDNRKHCVEVINYEGHKLRTIGKEGITDYPIFVKIGTNDELIVCNNYYGLRLTIFNRIGDQILVALKSAKNLKKCFDVTLTFNGTVFITTRDLKFIIMKVPPTVLKKLNWEQAQDNREKKMETSKYESSNKSLNAKIDSVWNKSVSVQNSNVVNYLINILKQVESCRAEYLPKNVSSLNDFIGNTKDVVVRSDKSFSKVSVQKEHPKQCDRWILDNYKFASNNFVEQSEEFENSGEMLLENQQAKDDESESESIKDNIWNMSFVRDSEIENEELFNNILFESEHFESRRRMLQNNSELEIPAESENLRSFSLAKDESQIRNIWSNNNPAHNARKNIWSNFVLMHDIDNKVRNIWSNDM